MMRRRILLAPLLVVAGGGPFLLGRMGLLPQSAGGSQQEQTPFVDTAADDSDAFHVSTLPFEDRIWASPAGQTAPQDPPQRQGPQVRHVGELFRMDVTPRWVIGQWSQISQTVSPTGFQGMRVPLIVADNSTRLYGSLTYYFDVEQRVQRIQFHGFAKNPDPWIAFIAQRHHLRRCASFVGGLYISQWNGAPTNVLRATYGSGQPSVAAGDVQIDLELNRPSAYYRLSDEFYALLTLERQQGKRAP